MADQGDIEPMVLESLQAIGFDPTGRIVVSVPRDRVLDPCCGSGTIFQAARETLTTATGIECDERAYGLALTKLQGAAVDEMLAAE